MDGTTKIKTELANLIIKLNAYELNTLKKKISIEQAEVNQQFSYITLDNLEVIGNLFLILKN